MMLLMKTAKWELAILSMILIAGLVGACGNVTPVPIGTETAVPSLLPFIPSTTPSPTPTVIPSPQSTIQFVITPNPDQITRWREYEHALASKLLFLHAPEEVLCEWEILGQSELVIYVWAFCLGLPPAERGEEYAPGASMPAVIHLGSNGSVQDVEIPGYSSSYAEGVRNLFPRDIQEKIFSRLINYADLIDHAKARRENPGPPLIVLLATPQP